MKNYFCAFINHAQDDSVNNLTMTEFAINNYINVSTEMMPFFANHVFYPCTGIKSFEIYNSEQKAKLLVVDQIVKR